MSSEQAPLGFLEYSGEGVKAGYLDARKAARALEGLDEAVRYYVGLQDPELQTVQFELPVRIEEGSWLALIPHNIGEWVVIALGSGLSVYLMKAAKTMAENDFKDVGLRTIFQNALRGIQWAIRIAKHTGDLTHRRPADPRWRNNNTEIGIPNEQNEYLFVPVAYFNMYLLCPPSLFSKMSSLVEPARELYIAVVEEGKIEKADITNEYKHIFCHPESDDDGVLFPELKHGDRLRLEGVVTRGNENTNSVGLLYEGHILNCVPRQGSVVRFKQALFLRCSVAGVVDRSDKAGGLSAPKPRIILEDVTPLEGEITETEKLPFEDTQE